MEKIKFRTEHEMGLHFCDWLLVGHFRNSFKIFAEVPRTAWNNHTDLIFINYKRKQCVNVELKLGSEKKLEIQRSRCFYQTRINTIGIINKNKVSNGLLKYSVSEGLDVCVMGYFANKRNWSSIFDSNLGKLYYYAFYFDESNYSGVGLPKREYVLYLLFQKAIESIFRIEGKVISFDIIQGLLPIYSVQVAKKYYNRVVNAGWKN